MADCASDTSPRTVILHNKISGSLLNEKRLEEAEAHAKAAIALDADTDKGYINAAKAASGLGDAKRAASYVKLGLNRPKLAGNADLLKIDKNLRAIMNISGSASQYAEESEEDVMQHLTGNTNPADLENSSKMQAETASVKMAADEPNEKETAEHGQHCSIAVTRQDLPKRLTSKEFEVFLEHLTGGMKPSNQENPPKTSRAASVETVAEKPKATKTAGLGLFMDLATESVKEETMKDNLTVRQRKLKRKRTDYDLAIHEAAELLLGHKHYVTAAHKYVEALNIITEFPAESLGLPSITDTVLKYCIVDCWCQPAFVNLEQMTRAIEYLTKIRKVLPAERFPAVFYGYAKVYYKLNRFSHSKELAIAGLDVLKTEPLIQIHCWPGSHAVIPETTREGLEKALHAVIKECSVYRPPDAKCRNPEAECFRLSKQIIPSQFIYYSDVDFNGYMEICCESKCVITYHINCWRDYKDKQSELCGSKRTDKDILGLPCPTEDCVTENGTLSIITYIALLFDDCKAKFVVGSKEKSPKKKPITAKVSAQPTKPTAVTARPNKTNVHARPMDKTVKGVQHANGGDEARALQEAVANFVALRKHNFNYRQSQIWDLDKPLFGRSELIRDDYFRMPRKPDPVRDFVLSYFKSLLERNSPMLISEVEEEWSDSVSEISDFIQLEKDKNFRGIINYLTESYQFVVIGENICLAKHLEAVNANCRLDSTECLQFLIEEDAKKLDASPSSNSSGLRSAVSETSLTTAGKRSRSRLDSARSVMSTLSDSGAKCLELLHEAEMKKAATPGKKKRAKTQVENVLDGKVELEKNGVAPLVISTESLVTAGLFSEKPVDFSIDSQSSCIVKSPTKDEKKSFDIEVEAPQSVINKKVSPKKGKTPKKKYVDTSCGLPAPGELLKFTNGGSNSSEKPELLPEKGKRDSKLPRDKPIDSEIPLKLSCIEKSFDLDVVSREDVDVSSSQKTKSELLPEKGKRDSKSPCEKPVCSEIPLKLSSDEKSLDLDVVSREDVDVSSSQKRKSAFRSLGDIFSNLPGPGEYKKAVKVKADLYLNDRQMFSDVKPASLATLDASQNRENKIESDLSTQGIMEAVKNTEIDKETFVISDCQVEIRELSQVSTENELIHVAEEIPTAAFENSTDAAEREEDVSSEATSSAPDAFDFVEKTQDKPQVHDVEVQTDLRASSIDDHEAKISNLKKQFNLMFQRAKNSDDITAALMDDLKELERRNQELETSNANKDEEIASLAKINAASKAERSEHQSLENANAELKHQLSELSAANCDLATELKTAQTDTRTVIQQRDECVKRCEAIESALNPLNLAANKVDGELKKLRQGLVEVKGECARLKSSEGALIALNLKASKEKIEVDVRCSQLVMQNAEIGEQLRVTTLMLEAIRQEAVALRFERDKFGKMLAEGGGVPKGDVNSVMETLGSQLKLAESQLVASRQANVALTAHFNSMGNPRPVDTDSAVLFNHLVLIHKELSQIKSNRCEAEFARVLKLLDEAQEDRLVAEEKKQTLWEMRANLGEIYETVLQANKRRAEVYNEFLNNPRKVGRFEDLPQMCSERISDEVYAALFDIDENYRQESESVALPKPEGPTAEERRAESHLLHLHNAPNRFMGQPPPPPVLQPPFGAQFAPQPFHPAYQPYRMPYPHPGQNNFHPGQNLPPGPHKNPLQGAPIYAGQGQTVGPNLVHLLNSPGPPGPQLAGAGGGARPRRSHSQSSVESDKSQKNLSKDATHRAPASTVTRSAAVPSGSRTVLPPVLCSDQSLINILINRFPNHPANELRECLEEIRKANKGSLKGCHPPVVVQKVGEMLRRKTQKPAWAPVAGVEGDGAAKWRNPLDETECAICMEAMVGRGLTTLPCDHIFHGKCIRKWLAINSVCPTCKRHTKTDDEYPPLK